MGKLNRAVQWLSKFTKKSSNNPASILQAQIKKLPIELVTHILVIAASDPELIQLTLRLTRLSRWTHAVIQPILYQSVHLRTDGQALRFLRAITINPELCRYVVTFDSPQVNIFRRAWSKKHIQDLCLPYVAALDKRAPHPQTIAKIFLILFQDEPTVVDRTNSSSLDVTKRSTASASAEWTHVVGNSRAPKLRSATIHALTLSPTFDVVTHAHHQLGAPLMRLPPDVTLSGFGTSSLMKGHFTNVQRLRFTSVVNGGTLRITDLLALPNLTHLALPLWRSTFETTKLLLASEQIKRLVLFVLFDPINEEDLLRATSDPISSGNAAGTPSTSNTFSPTLHSTAIPSNAPSSTSAAISSNAPSSTSASNSTNLAPPSSLNPNSSTSSLQDVFLESEALKGIHDNRLILFNIRELVTLCQVPTQRFWDEVELRATHPAAHVVLGKLRSLAGQTLSDR